MHNAIYTSIITTVFALTAKYLKVLAFTIVELCMNLTPLPLPLKGLSMEEIILINIHKN